jgi:hypothetical protein
VKSRVGMHVDVHDLLTVSLQSTSLRTTEVTCVAHEYHVSTANVDALGKVRVFARLFFFC